MARTSSKAGAAACDPRAAVAGVLSVALWGACGVPATVERPSAVAQPVASAGGALGANDISILLPRPRESGKPIVESITGEGAPLVSRARFEDLVANRADIAAKNGKPIAFEDFHVVALRFELCRDVPAPAHGRRECLEGPGGGQLRLVLQPFYFDDSANEVIAHDVALHAFYPIAQRELANVVGELRALAAIQRTAASAPLMVSAAAADGDARYLQQLRGLLARYTGDAKLARLTVIGQLADSAAFAWMFRGVEYDGGTTTAIVIPGIDATEQTVQLSGGDTIYNAHPIVDAPAGFVLAANGVEFAAATANQQRAAVAALRSVQEPRQHTSENLQCVTCHVATFLTARRTNTVGPSIAARDARVVRAFGWAGPLPAISDRVVNETAVQLEAIATRFPAN